MQYTEYMELKKPDNTDFYNIHDHNDNMDVIDAKFEEIDGKFTEQKLGYPIIKTSDTNITLQPNTVTWVNGVPSSLVITLATPDEEVESEYRLTFLGGFGPEHIRFIPPTGMRILLPFGKLAYKAGYIYEFSFVNLNATIIAGTYKEIRL